MGKKAIMVSVAAATLMSVLVGVYLEENHMVVPAEDNQVSESTMSEPWKTNFEDIRAQSLYNNKATARAMGEDNWYNNDMAIIQSNFGLFDEDELYSYNPNHYAKLLIDMYRINNFPDLDYQLTNKVDLPLSGDVALIGYIVGNGGSGKAVAVRLFMQSELLQYMPAGKSNNTARAWINENVILGTAVKVDRTLYPVYKYMLESCGYKLSREFDETKETDNIISYDNENRIVVLE